MKSQRKTSMSVFSYCQRIVHELPNATPLHSFSARCHLGGALWTRDAWSKGALLTFTTSVLLLTLLTSCTRRSSESEPTAKKPNIVLIVVDTLPANQLGAYSQGLRNSPHIDALADKGVRFTAARSVSSWTKPSIASTFTALYPSFHGVTAMRDRLPEQHVTLAEELQDTGYSTAGFVSHTILAARVGYAQGFETYEQLNRERNVHEAITSHLVADAATEWLTSHAASENPQPFFLYMHYFDPHFRYHSFEEFDFADGYSGELRSNMSLDALMRRKDSFSEEDVDFLRNLQREEIAYTDMHIARVLETLREQGIEENTIVILTADHGEEFMEHGSLGHTSTLYEEVVHIPLIVAWPGRIAPGSDPTPVSLIDVMPTLLDLCCQIARDHWEGESLAESLLAGSHANIERDIFMEVAYRQVARPHVIDPNKIAVVSGEWKLILDRARGRLELYNLAEDPAEKRDLADERFDVVERLRPRMAALEEVHRRGHTSGGEESDFSPEQVESLRSLGYL